MINLKAIVSLLQSLNMLRVPTKVPLYNCVFRIYMRQKLFRNYIMWRYFRSTVLMRYYCSNTKCVTENIIKEIPRPKSLPIFGTALSLLAAGGGSRLHEYIDKRHKQLGPIFCENMNGADVIFTSDPEFMRTLFIKLEGKYPAHILPEPWVLYNKKYGMKRGLFFMDGEEWLQNRKTLNKLILREGSESWLEGPVKDVTQDLVDKWKIKSENGVIAPDLEREFYRFSIDVIVSILTGTSKAIRTQQYDFMLDMFAESVQKIFQTTTKLYVWPTLYANFNLQAWRNFKESVDTSLALARKFVKNIVLMKDEFGDGLIRRLINEKLSEEDITRIVADFVIAAGDTTSYTLLWTLYILSNNPEVISELRQKNTKYANYVIKESMRLYPVAPFLSRIIPKECKLGYFMLKQGTPIVASIYTSGRSEANFTKADLFLPHRWDREEHLSGHLTRHVPSASLPFALGSRSCVGKKIAQLQLIQVLTKVTENFDLKLLNEKRVDAVMSQVLVPKHPIQIQFVRKD